MQIVRVLPSVLLVPTPGSIVWWSAFDTLMIVWVFLMSARSVVTGASACATGLVAGARRRPRADRADVVRDLDRAERFVVEGAVRRRRRIRVIPIRLPSRCWPRSRSCSTTRSANLDDERSNVTDLYFVGFAGDAREDVFRKDVQAAQRVMDERWGTDGRSVVLINNPRTLLESPEATVTNLRETLNEIGATIDAEQDVVMVYLASHGNRQHVLEVALPPLELAPLTAPALRGLLDAAGIKWRIVVVSACYSGGFIEALKDDNTLVLTASAADRASFGCGNQSDSTFFGEALFQHGPRAIGVAARGVRRGEGARRRARKGGRVQAAVESADLRRAGDGRQAEGARPRQRRAPYRTQRLESGALAGRALV